MDLLSKVHFLTTLLSFLIWWFGLQMWKNGSVSKQDDNFKIPEDIKCPCIAQLEESSCKNEFLTSFRCYLENRSEEKGNLICKAEFDKMESCMRRHPQEFGDEDIKMFEETVRSGFKFRDFLGFSRSLRKQNKT